MGRFKDFTNVEIFAAGKWNNREFTTEDLDEIVEAYSATKGQLAIPLKIGHTDKQRFLSDDMPSFGWIENVRRSGSKLIADLKNVPESIASLIENGAYRSRSVEILPNQEIGDKTYKFLLSGMALLGATLPAVSGLADIVALYKREEIDHDKEAEFVIVFNEKFKEPEQVDRIKMAKLLGLSDDATEEQIEAKIQELQKEPETNTNTEDKPKENPELFQANARILALETQVAQSEAASTVDAAIRNGKLLPKQRDFAIKLAMQNKEEFAQFVDVQPNVVEFGEHGTSDDKGLDFAKFEPTAEEISIAKGMGLWNDTWRINLMREKAKAEGIEIPAEFGKEKVNS